MRRNLHRKSTPIIRCREVEPLSGIEFDTRIVILDGTNFPINGVSGKFNWLGPPAGEHTDNPTFQAAIGSNSDSGLSASIAAFQNPMPTGELAENPTSRKPHRVQ